MLLLINSYGTTPSSCECGPFHYPRGFKLRFACNNPIERKWPHASLQSGLGKKMVGGRHCLHGFALRVSVHVLTANLMSDLNIRVSACTSSIYSMTYNQLLEEFNCSHEIAILGLSLFIWGMGRPWFGFFFFGGGTKYLTVNESRGWTIDIGSFIRGETWSMNDCM